MRLVAVQHKRTKRNLGLHLVHGWQWDCLR